MLRTTPTPKIIRQRAALVKLHPCTKFSVARSKGVGARGHKAGKRDCALRAQFWPHWVITYMAHPPYQGASSLQVWGLCDLPFEIFVQLMLFFRKKRKFSNFDPPNFWTPLNFKILKDLVILHPCTKFGEISSKGVGARGQKAEKRDCALRAQIWPLGVIAYMAHPPYQSASTLQVSGLYGRPFEKSVQLMLFC